MHDAKPAIAPAATRSADVGSDLSATIKLRARSLAQKRMEASGITLTRLALLP